MVQKKKILGIFFISAIVILLLSNVAFAKSGAMSGTCGTCEWSIDKDGVLTISGGEMTDWGERPPWGDSCGKIFSVKVENTVTLATCKNMFAGCNATQISMDKFVTENVTDMSGMFFCCNNLKKLDISNLNTSKVTTMESMFYSCENLQSLDVSRFDTSNVTSMEGMFTWCSSLTALDVSHFDTSNVIYLRNMFAKCSLLNSLDVSHFNTSNAEYFEFMFDGCSLLTELDVSGFDTSKTRALNGMFYECRNLKSIDVSSFNTSNATMFISVFQGCECLTSLDLRSFDTHNGDDLYSMFEGCKSLETVDLSSFDLSEAYNMKDMFKDCTAMKQITVGKGWIYHSTNTNLYPTFPVDMKDTSSGITYAAYASVPNLADRTYVAHKGFVLGRDNNSYIHNYPDQPNSGFYGIRDHSMGAAYSAAMAKESDLGGTAANLIISSMTSHGWCYGIAATMALVHEGYLSVEDISSDTATTYYDMSPPCLNEQLKNTINYYFVSQTNIRGQVGYYTTIPAGMIHGTQIFISEASMQYHNFLKKLVDAAEEGTLLFGIPGHAILITDCNKNEDGTYTLQVYDENSVWDHTPYGNYGKINIDLPRFRFEYINHNGDVQISAEESENTELYFSTAGAIASASKEGIKTAKHRSILTIPRYEPVTLRDKNGQIILAVKNGVVNALDTPVHQAWLYLTDVAGEEHSKSDEYIQLELDQLDDIVIEYEGENAIEIGLRDSENAAEIKGCFDKATLDMGEGISIDGTATDFFVGMSSDETTENGDKAVLTMSGSSITDLNVDADSESPAFDVTARNGSEDTEVSYYDGNGFHDTGYEESPGEIIPDTPAKPTIITKPTAGPKIITDLPAVKILKPKAAKKAATIKWKKVNAKNRKKIAKIQIQYSTDKNFKKNVKTVYAKKNAASKKIKKLKSKKKYYVRIRAYKKVGKKVHVSKWSAKKAFKVN